MKKLLLILIFLFVSSNPLNGQTNKWTEVYKNTNGDIEYIDFENIREIGGYIYWFNLTNYLEPRKNIMSFSTYFKGDCIEMKFKFLNGRSINFQLNTEIMNVKEIIIILVRTETCSKRYILEKANIG